MLYLGFLHPSASSTSVSNAMRGLTSPLWPIHLKPLPDELLSSWLVRIAHGHGLKVQTFCNLVFGGRRQVWNRDIDRLAPAWLLDELIDRTGTTREVAYGTTLLAYEDWLYEKMRISGASRWILTLQMYHRKRTGFGLQYCPRCLGQDRIPYFRKRWRVAFYLICTKHRVRLLDRCPRCDSVVAFHRIELGKPNVFQVESLAVCHMCGFDLSNAKAERVGASGDQATNLLMRLCQVLETTGSTENQEAGADHLVVLHQLCKLMYSPRKQIHLREFVAAQLGIVPSQIVLGKTPFESRGLVERTEILMMALWMKVNLRVRLHDAWRGRALRYNHMLKDFEDPPEWYVQLTEKFSNWRWRL